jgi:hypothetical protein
MSSKKLTAVLLVVAINGAVDAPSAAAAAVFNLTATTCTGGSNVAFCYETANGEKLELTGEQSETVEGPIVLFSIKTVPEQKIECTHSKGSGTIFQTEPLVSGKQTTLKGTVTYENCKLTTEPRKKCIVSVNNTTKPLVGTLVFISRLTFSPESGTTLVELTYANNGTEKCPATFLGKHSVSGSQNFEVVGGAFITKELYSVGKTLKFFSAEGELSQNLTLTFEGLDDDVYVSDTA